MSNSNSCSKAMFKLYRIAFEPTRKPLEGFYVWFLFTHENSDFGAMSVMSEAAPPICFSARGKSHMGYSCFEKGCRKKCTRQSRKVLWVVFSSLFFK